MKVVIIVWIILSTKIIFSTTPKGNITYIYNAVGQKLQKLLTETSPSSTTTTNYLGGFQYQGVKNATPSLQFFPTAEGYVRKEASSYKYVFNYTDHLGNVRLSYTRNTNGTLSIIEENNYYPFGLKHSPYNAYTPTDTYKYKYNNREW